MSTPKKITYVISGVNYSLGFLWLSKHLDKGKFIPEFIWLNKTEPEMIPELKSAGIINRYIKLESKAQYPLIFIRLLAHFLKRRPEIVHAHLFEACLLALPAAFMAFIPKRIHTRHHSTFHADYFPHMVKYDRFINFLSTDIVSISKNVSDILIENEGVNPKKIHLVHHGFDFHSFEHVEPNRIAELKKKYGIDDFKHPVIGVISRFVEWKGIQYIIPAFENLMKTHPNSHLVLANAVGSYKPEIDKLIRNIPSGNISLIEFEKELPLLYKTFDFFIHVPIDSKSEAFGQVYVEALAVGIPSIFTLSGIANDFIKDRINAIVVPYKNSDSISDAMYLLMENQELRNKIIENGRKDVERHFDLKNMIHKLELVYE